MVDLDLVQQSAAGHDTNDGLDSINYRQNSGNREWTTWPMRTVAFRVTRLVDTQHSALLSM